MTESRTSRDDRKVHIYIDISNITCGAIGVTNIHNTKLNIPCLIDVVSKRREVVRKVFDPVIQFKMKLETIKLTHEKLLMLNELRLLLAQCRMIVIRDNEQLRKFPGKRSTSK